MSFKMNSFPIQKGRIGAVATDVISGIALCIEDGVLAVTWEAGGTSDVTVLAGQSINLVNATEATITSGVFHYTI